jgi:ElaB/YqjD/DUF883 family membrane-anchored ribosome-binding protein
MKSQNTKSSDELQKEVRHEIRNVRKDIDELQGRFSPGQLIDDVIFYPHGRSPAATFDHLKRNPVGTAFLSLGTLLLMEDESNQSLETLSKNKITSTKNKVSEFSDKTKSRVTELSDKVRSKLPVTPGMSPSAKELAMDKVNEVRDKMDQIESDVEYKVAAARDKFGGVKDEMSESLPDLPETPDMASLKNKVSDKFSGLLSSSKDKVRDLDPTTFMALGAGLGVITGASLPLSETEKSFVDDKLQDKLSGFSTDLQSAINECSNILKDLVISDVKDFRVNLF